MTQPQTTQPSPIPQIDIGALSTKALLFLERQRDQLQAMIDQNADEVRRLVAVMNTGDLRRLLEREHGKRPSSNATKDDMVEVYIAARIDASPAKKRLAELEAAARADRTAAGKINDMARGDVEMEAALTEEIAEYGLRACLRSVRIMELSVEHHAALHARHVIQRINGGKELREVLLDEFGQLFDTVARYPSVVRSSGTGPASAARLEEHGDAAGAAMFLREVAGAYVRDLTMAIPMAYMR